MRARRLAERRHVALGALEEPRRVHALQREPRRHRRAAQPERQSPRASATSNARATACKTAMGRVHASAGAEEPSLGRASPGHRRRCGPERPFLRVDGLSTAPYDVRPASHVWRIWSWASGTGEGKH